MQKEEIGIVANELLQNDTKRLSTSIIRFVMKLAQPRQDPCQAARAAHLICQRSERLITESIRFKRTNTNTILWGIKND